MCLDTYLVKFLKLISLHKASIQRWQKVRKLVNTIQPVLITPRHPFLLVYLSWFFVSAEFVEEDEDTNVFEGV